MQPSVIAHIFMTAFQCGYGGARVVLCLFGLADVCCACERIQAAMSEWGICVVRIKKPREAGTQLRFTHIASRHTVGSITVASDFT